MINQALQFGMDYTMGAFSAMDKRVAVVVGVSMVLGALLIPLALRIAAFAITTLSLYAIKAGAWLADTTVVMNLRGLACEDCADHHRGHV